MMNALSEAFNFPNIIHNTAWSGKGLTSILTLT